MTAARSTVTIAALVLAATPLAAQTRPTRTFTKPDVEYAEPFSQLSGLRELKDGRVIAIDMRDKIVQAVDLKAGTAEKIGREGSGPGEYALPRSILPLPGDSSAIFDMLNNRLLIITPAAKAGGFLELASGAGGRGTVVFGASAPNAIDRNGSMYYQGQPFKISDNGPPQALDSVPVMRGPRASARRDTLAWIQLPKGGTQIGGRGRGEVSVRIGGGGPFPSQDQWAVSPDGRVAIVHVDPYRVDYIGTAGNRTLGQAIKYDKLKVSEGHKKEWREQQKNALGLAITNENGKQSAQMVRNPNPQEPDSWPEFLPPFLANAVMFAPDGSLWVRRTTAPGQVPTFDVVDPSGKVVQQVQLPAKTRLVAFGTGTMYLARTDEDDLQYLQRYRFTMTDRP